MNLQTVAQTRLPERQPPGSRLRRPAGARWTARRNGCEPVNTGHDNAGFNLTAAVQQTVVYILINLAQFQAHRCPNHGAVHELRQVVEKRSLGRTGLQRPQRAHSRMMDSATSSAIFAELLLSFLQLQQRTFTSSGFVLLCFLLIDALCGQSDALRGTFSVFPQPFSALRQRQRQLQQPQGRQQR